MIHAAYITPQSLHPDTFPRESYYILQFEGWPELVSDKYGDEYHKVALIPHQKLRIDEHLIDVVPAAHEFSMLICRYLKSCHDIMKRHVSY